MGGWCGHPKISLVGRAWGRGGGGVCESLVLNFILGVATNHWFYIRCDWSPMRLIRLRFPS